MEEGHVDKTALVIYVNTVKLKGIKKIRIPTRQSAW